ncbi:hypothetical protein [Streptacidiphilus jiangxiensis]|uniref:Uncharacterized protein n=1 Tax=Streptacidiphilus jiangxiensis TaxID=235985 RepID=A0A1H7I1M1_STRJI|nr:hypothetical protein [Streptacidiphilus jiangxiensis]SEK56503.1 hypothetical protein SAMN05414137_102465 [Streptacidiphilus jiangxiensis]
MHGSRRNAWLGLTPEPELELPYAVARLRARGSAASAESSETERSRVERLILHGTQRTWLAYLHEVAELVVAVATGTGPPGGDQIEAALVAGEVVLGHHRMLIGLPGPAYEQTAADRALLGRAVERLARRQPAPSDRPSRDATARDAATPHGTTRDATTRDATTRDAQAGLR